MRQVAEAAFYLWNQRGRLVQ
ncbi:DUF2934 domain-containing protein [Peribacillus butanolivorans]|uniref:DUF2934 domain-containing protein n=1 Tax=Peribacillus butanolivorans TaxID=421767 RepID=A0ABN5N8N9_9BACI|nr:DUF2934 domain-containing protein [Peribacillus butanolivorans]